MKKICNFNWCGYCFEKIGEIQPAINEEGKVITYSHINNEGYSTQNGYRLMKGGEKDFCYLVIVDGNKVRSNIWNSVNVDVLPDEEGVYLWVINNYVQYVGRATGGKNNTLYKRFKYGYGKITPRNCYKRGNSYGQATNLKMNNLVIEEYKKENTIELYICKCKKNSKDVEKNLIENNWCNKVDKHTLKYNDRH